MNIKYIGIRGLDEQERFTLKKISETSYPKIGRLIENPLVFLTIKKQKIAGRRHRIIIDARVSAPNIRYSSWADEWDIAKATHRVFDKLEREIEHKIKD
ncbi:MAG: hypothetical protein ABIB47_01150 [Candidatus Woesearchaeota archaeon]